MGRKTSKSYSYLEGWCNQFEAAIDERPELVERVLELLDEAEGPEPLPEEDPDVGSDSPDDVDGLDADRGGTSLPGPRGPARGSAAGTVGPGLGSRVGDVGRPHDVRRSPVVSATRELIATPKRFRNA